MAAPLLQAQVDISAPASNGLGTDQRFPPDATVEPAVPVDAAAGRGPSRHAGPSI